MKKFKSALVLVVLFMSIVLLVGCKGSKKIQGTWKAQDSTGKNSTIQFKENVVVIDNQEYDYKQNATGFKNQVSYYGITQNGEQYSIIFPEKNKNIALLIRPTSTDDYLAGEMLYALNRKEEPNYKEYAEKYFK
ncbi:glycosyltransferase [Streptococcus pluranimalium]|uniref:Glycosyltransferase n=1 Tax=Streptococcus pluranimalium TaxID=82348 RepID=A0A2L0D3F8_9STRE|nr:glycosyltransferase [Streptococcus pluranimalium]AUW96363.1 glycosyltransferase [Streptococcus pluranimalium]